MTSTKYFPYGKMVASQKNSFKQLENGYGKTNIILHVCVPWTDKSQPEGKSLAVQNETSTSSGQPNSYPRVEISLSAEHTYVWLFFSHTLKIKQKKSEYIDSRMRETDCNRLQVRPSVDFGDVIYISPRAQWWREMNTRYQRSSWANRTCLFGWRKQ